MIDLDLKAFVDETASESPAPGGGSVAAYLGALGASLSTMVANLSAHKRGWDDRWEEFSKWAEEGQALKDALLKLVDEDTYSFNAILEAIRLPKGTEAEKVARKEAIQAATKYAIEVPFQTMELSLKAFDLAEAMIQTGNPNSITDACVGALCCRTAVHGAYLNVKINCGDLEDQSFVESILEKGAEMIQEANKREQAILEQTNKALDQ